MVTGTTGEDSCDVTIAAVFEVREAPDDDDDDDSSKDRDSDGKLTVTTPSADDAPTQVTITAKPDVSRGTASLTVSESTMKTAIQKAQQEAKKAGTAEQGIAIEIQADSGSKTVSQLLVSLSNKTLSALEQAQVEQVRLTSSFATLVFDLDVIEEIRDKTDADIRISIADKTQNTLPEQVQRLIGGRPVYDLHIETKRGERLTNFDHSIAVAIPYALRSGEQAENLIACYIDETGGVEKIGNAYYDADSKAVCFDTTHFSLFAVGYEEAPAIDFTDIDAHWAKENIRFAAARGLLSGMGNDTFSPDTPMTRGMFVTVLGRLAGVDPAAYQETPFTDADLNRYDGPYAAWAAEKGIASGMTAAAFAPDANITRQQMAAILANYAKAMGYEIPQTREAVTFADHSAIAPWAAEAVTALQRAGILNGRNGNVFDPAGTATRAEVATVLRGYVEQIVDPAAK